MSATLEQRVAALEAGELERLRELAARRLEKLRQERAAVADLRERLEDATRALAVLSAKYAEIAALASGDASESVERLRDHVTGTDVDDAADVVIEKAITELLDTRSHLKDALEELAEANAKLAKLAAVKFASGEDMFTYGDMAALQALYKIGQQRRTLHAELVSNGAWRASAYTSERCCGGEGATVAEAVASIGRKLQ